MPRPLLGHQQLVANWDPATDHVEMIGMVPGPAGVASLELDLLTVEIDVANPASVAFISIPDVSAARPEGRLRGVLTDLIGSASADVVLEMSGSSDAGRVIVGGGASTQPGARERVRPEVASLAIALSQAGTPGLRPAERAAAVLQAFTLAERSGVLAHMTWLTAEVDSALEQLDESGPAGLRDSGSSVTDSLIEICTEAASYFTSPTAVSRVLAFADRLSGMPTEESIGRRPRAIDGVELAEVSPDSLTVVCGAPDLELRHTEADEFEVRIAGWADRTDGWWVRVFSVDGETPVAMAPLLPDGDDAAAHLLIPPAHQNQLQIDVVDEPLRPRLSPTAVAFRAAIINGQRAARYQRLGRADEAVAAWRQSEQWHRTAGDEARARQADAIASQQRAFSLRFTPSDLSPVITDHLDVVRRERET